MFYCHCSPLPPTDRPCRSLPRESCSQSPGHRAICQLGKMTADMNE